MITETIPISYTMTARNQDFGVQVAVLPGDREAPEYWTDDDTYFLLKLHQSGSPCPASCGCVTAEQRTRIGYGETLTIGNWIWSGDRSWAVGWLRTGPSETEKALAERIEILEEDVDHEAGLHHVTKADLGHCIRRIEKLQERRGLLRESLRRARTAAIDAEGRFGIALQVAYAGWSVAILIAALWVSAVIA